MLAHTHEWGIHAVDAKAHTEYPAIKITQDHIKRKKKQAKLKNGMKNKAKGESKGRDIYHTSSLRR